MTELDLDEMFHLAIHASSKGDHERAIVLLKQGAERENSARFHYMLGAEHAEIGMLDRAIQDMEKTLSLDGSIAEARFQLGLLYALRDDKIKAVNTWAELDNFPEKPHLICFKTAIEHYFKQNVEAAISKMQEGIALNKTNPALNKDMSNLIENWKSTAAQSEDESSESSDSTGHHFLSAYKDRH